MRRIVGCGVVVFVNVNCTTVVPSSVSVAGEGEATHPRSLAE